MLSSLDPHFYTLIIGLFRFAKIWFRIKEKIHIKAVVNVSKIKASKFFLLECGQSIAWEAGFGL